MTSTTTVPARTRPRNRRQTILAVAAELFAASGFHNVSTDDIARAVGVGASALYRHVRGKEDLLEAALLAEFEEARKSLDGAAPQDLETAVQTMASTFAQRRRMALLWTREARHLPDEARQRVRAPFYHVFERLIQLVDAQGRSDDPELTALAVIAVLTSPAYHSTPLPAERIATLTADLALAAAAVRLDLRRGPAEASQGVTSTTRPAAIMAAATRLFSARGYQSVTMQDIGDAVGATSTSLYRHFATKGDLLTAIMTRATEALHLGLDRALATSPTPADALRATVAEYIEFAIDRADLLWVLVAELTNIPDSARHSLRRAQSAYVAEWFALLEAARPELGRTEVRFRVHAALTIVNDAVRTPRVRRHAGVARNIARLAESVLWSDVACAAEGTPVDNLDSGMDNDG